MANRTARQKAALRKAQLASARKRRGRKRVGYVAAGIGVVGVTVAAGFGARHYAKHTLSGGPRAHKTSTSTELVHVPGLGRNLRQTIGSRERLRRRALRVGQPHGRNTIAVDRGGVAVVTRQNANNPQWRNNYNEKRRKARLRAKPKPKVGYSISTKGSARAGKRRSRARKRNG